MRINAAIAGDRTSSQEKRNADLKEFEKTFAELGFTISAKEKSFKAKEPESGYQPHCYLQGEPTEAPCLDGYLIINSSGDSIIENGQKLIDLFADKSNRKISHTELSLLNADEALKQARLLALKDGKLMAKRIAKEL